MDAELKDMDIVEAIVEFMAGRCACTFTADQLTDRVFMCYSSIPQSVTFRAQLHGTLQAPVTDLITKIEEWASSGDNITVQFLPLTLNGACAYYNSSTEECEITELTDIGGGTSGTSQSTAIIAGVVTVFILGVLIILILISIFIAIRVRKTKLKPKDEQK